jgi:hypothetical protein
VIHPAQSVGSGVTIQLYRVSKNLPTISNTYAIFAGSGVSTLSSGVTCFNTWSSGGTEFYEDDVVAASVVGISDTVKWISFVLKLLKL